MPQNGPFENRKNKSTFLLNSKVPKDHRGVNQVRHWSEIGFFGPKCGLSTIDFGEFWGFKRGTAKEECRLEAEPD